LIHPNGADGFVIANSSKLSRRPRPIFYNERPPEPRGNAMKQSISELGAEPMRRRRFRRARAVSPAARTEKSDRRPHTSREPRYCL
jgi:hypothetical protein